MSLKSVRGDGVVLYLVGAVGEMQGDSRNGITFGLDLDSGVVCPTLKPWKYWEGGVLLPSEKNSMVRVVCNFL